MSNSLGLTFYITKDTRFEGASIRCLLFAVFRFWPLTSDLGPPSSNLLSFIFLAFPRSSFLEPVFQESFFSVPSLSAMSHEL